MFLKNLSLKIKFYLRDFRYSNYIKLKSIRKKNLVDIEQFNKNFLNRDNELTEIMKKLLGILVLGLLWCNIYR